MQFIFSLFTSYPFIEPPKDIFAWIGLSTLSVVFLIGVFASRREKAGFSSRRWLYLVLIIVFTCLSTLFIGFRFPAQNSSPLFQFTVIYHPTAVMVFSAIPIVLAGAFFGPITAGIMGATSGLLVSVWDTHSYFTILELGLLGFIFAWMIRQRFQSKLFAHLHHPIITAIVFPIVFAPLVMLSSLFAAGGELAIRLDFALTQTWPIIAGWWLEFLAAGIIAESLYLSRITGWVRPGKPVLPVFEKSLSAKFTFTIVPVFLAAFIVLLIGDWVVAGSVSKKLMEDRLGNMSMIAADSLPYFLETGQNLLTNYADELSLNTDVNSIPQLLSEYFEAIPFFSSFFVLDENGDVLQNFPMDSEYPTEIDELAVVDLALGGAKIQTCILTPLESSQSARVAFVARIGRHQSCRQPDKRSENQISSFGSIHRINTVDTYTPRPKDQRKLGNPMCSRKQDCL